MINHKMGRILTALTPGEGILEFHILRQEKEEPAAYQGCNLVMQSYPYETIK